MADRSHKEQDPAPLRLGHHNENIHISGHARVQLGDFYNQSPPDDNAKCLQDLHLTDPRHDRTRIEETKGGLLKDSCRWILDNPDFQKWRSDPQSRLLWIKGDPGKGKTMLLCGIIDELKKSTAETELLSYFFCQGTDSRINNATAVLRGLIYLLVEQQPSLLSHVRIKYDHAGKALFENANAWVALSDIFTNILQDPNLNTTYLVIDALDECITDLPRLLKLIIQKLSVPSYVKWIVSSRNWPNIEEQLKTAEQLSLELNAESVSSAVTIYIQHKVTELAQLKKYNHKTESAVQDYLLSNANNTFLWVALVCQNLEKVSRWNTLAKLNTIPPGLDAFYEIMIQQICNSDDVDFIKRVLAFVTITRRPITLNEFTSFFDELENISDDLESLQEIVGLCGSFLTLKECTIYFVHQSAKDFLLEKAGDKVFPFGIEEVNYTIFSRSLEVMSRTLQRDMYNLQAPGFPIDKIKQPDPDPLTTASYSCIYWVDHLEKCNSSENVKHSGCLQDGSEVDIFLRKKYLYWLEALSLLRSTSEGVLSMIKLEGLLQGRVESSQLINLVRDAHRFILYNRWTIENNPLQVYASALVFSPVRSLIREEFKQEEPKWISQQPKVELGWNAVLQTLEGHSNKVSSVAFSHDSKLLASASYDMTIKVWDTATGALQQTLEGHSDVVQSVAFSDDSKMLASASHDKTIKIWDTATFTLQRTLEGHSNMVHSVAFSHDLKLLASLSDDDVIKIWDTATGTLTLQQTLEGHSDMVQSVAFSHNSKLLASASYDMTIKVWDTATGALQRTLDGHSDMVQSVAFSHDSKLLASASHDKTIKIWDTATGALQRTLEGHNDVAQSVAFSDDSKLLTSASYEKTIKIWDTATGALKLQQTLEGYSSGISSWAFSHDSKLVASVSYGKTIKIWDATTSTFMLQQTLEGHSNRVSSMDFSHDSKLLASASHDKTIKIWDTATSTFTLQQTLEGHRSAVSSVAFSHDSKLLASASYDTTIKVWDTATGALQQTLEGHSSMVQSVAFSDDSKLLASVSHDKTIKIWDMATSAFMLQQTLEGHRSAVTSITFSRDSKLLASASYDKTVRVWDLANISCRQIVTVKISILRVVFDSTDTNFLTNIGCIKVDKTGLSPTSKSSQVRISDSAVQGLQVNGSWITWNLQNLLWLPADYRSEIYEILPSGSTIVIGCESGRVLVIGFSLSAIPQTTFRQL